MRDYRKEKPVSDVNQSRSRGVKFGDECVLGGLRFATIGLHQRSQEAFLDGFTGVQETVSAGRKFRVSSMKLTCLDNF